MADQQKKGVGVVLLSGMANLMALMPFSVLYLFSDFLFLVVYYLVRYRRKMVRMNLMNAFPDKSVTEIVVYEKEFYHHLCDYFVETVKTLRMSEEEVKKRMHFVNPELLNQLVKDGHSCIMCLGHYANWEWVTSIVFHLLPGVDAGLVYKELHSNAFDRLFKEVRSRFGAYPIEKRTVFRKLVRRKNEGDTIVVGFLTDQRPPVVSDKYWTTFMNQDTPVQTGMEKIARSLSMSVVYADVEKVKRGYYRVHFVTITPDATTDPEHVVTEKYIRSLEKTVMRSPGYYLWSHNLWKFKKEEDHTA